MFLRDRENRIKFSTQNPFHKGSSVLPEIMPELKIHLFGAFEVLCCEQPIQHTYWQSRQVRTIFKLLIIQRGRPLSSTAIVEVLWPQEKPDVALKRLYIRISQLRRILTKLAVKATIQTVTGGYVFDCADSQQNKTSGCWIDVDVFEKLADQGRLLFEQKQVQEAAEIFEKASGLYRGDYLIEDQYDDWSMAERERLRDRYLVLLTELSEAYAQMGQYRRAINACQKVLQLDSCREAVFVRLMLFYYYAGEKPKALQTYEHCQQILWEELGVLPDSSTVALATKIENGSLWQQTGSPLYPPPNYEGRLYEVPYSLGELPLVGRDREYAWLVNHWERSPGAIFLIDGEPGIGKSRLLETFRGYLHSRGISVFLMKGIAGQQTPYSLFFQMKQNELENKDQSRYRLPDLLSAEIHQAQPSQSTPDYHHAADLIKAYLNEYPVQSMLIVDDAQWADKASLNLLAELVGNITIVFVFRSGENPYDAQQTDLSIGQQNSVPQFHLTLSRLTLTVVKTLINQLSGSQLPDFESFVFEKTGGNPLFILAFLQNLFEIGSLLVKPNGKWVWLEKEEVDPVPNLFGMIETRLRSLRLEERRILDVIAVAGGSIDMDVLHTVLESSEMSVIRSLDLLLERAYVVEPRTRNEAELALAHGLYTEAIYETLPDFRKCLLHRRIATALVSLGKDEWEYAARVAHHAMLGEDFERAVTAFNRAGWYALKVYVPQQAASYFASALKLMENLPAVNNSPLMGEILFGQAECWRLLGKYEQAMTGYTGCVNRLPAILKQAAIYQAFQLNMMSGVPLQNFETLADQLKTDLQKEGDSWALALLHWGQAFSELLHGKVKETIQHNRDGWRVARTRTGRGEVFPPWIWQRAYTLLARMHIQWGNLYTARRVVRCLINQAEETGQQNNLAAAQAWLGEVYLGLSQYEEAQAAFLVGLEIAEKANDPRLCGETKLGLGRVGYERGDFEAAAHYAEQVLMTSEKNNDVLRQLNATILKAKLSLKTDQAQDLLPRLLNLLMVAKYLGVQPYVVSLLTVLIEIHIHTGEVEKAADLLSEALLLAEQCALKPYLGILKRCQARLQQSSNSVP